MFLINGRIVGLDSFGKRSTFAKVFAKLLDSSALDAIDWYEPDCTPPTQEPDIQAFINAIASAHKENYRAVSLGTEIRFETQQSAGFVLEYNQSILHLSAFTKISGEAIDASTSRIERFTRRRKHSKRRLS